MYILLLIEVPLHTKIHSIHEIWIDLLPINAHNMMKCRCCSISVTHHFYLTRCTERHKALGRWSEVHNKFAILSFTWKQKAWFYTKHFLGWVNNFCNQLKRVSLNSQGLLQISPLMPCVTSELCSCPAFSAVRWLLAGLQAMDMKTTHSQHTKANCPKNEMHPGHSWSHCASGET